MVVRLFLRDVNSTSLDFIMYSSLKKALFILSLFGILSCTPSAPYEIKSPCVSIDGSDYTYGVNPCVRRPVNMNYAIV